VALPPTVRSSRAELEVARGTEISSPQWSPDGSEILFSKREVPGDGAAKNSGIYVVSRLGGTARLIGQGLYACWLSPDGSQIATASQAERSGFRGVRLVNKSTGEAKEISLSDYAFLNHIDCSPGADLILAVTQTPGKFQIWTVRSNGSQQHKLIEANDQIDSARWSPSGESIYYLQEKGSTSELSKVSVTDRHSEPDVLVDGLQAGSYFTLSAHGSRLAYTRADRASNLWRVDLSGAERGKKSEITRLTAGTSYYSGPSFSPDGRWIAFALGPSSYETNIFKMQVASGTPIQLSFFEHATTLSPVWSPDGERIAFEGDQNGARRV
jgi:Tol biopolymer transport system component